MNYNARSNDVGGPAVKDGKRYGQAAQGFGVRAGLGLPGVPIAVYGATA